MASVQMEAGKHTTKQATSGNIPHDFRERENYANPDIDSSRTHLNQRFGCETGKEAREKLLKRIAECDAEHPPKRLKKDRKTSLEIHIPAPREGLDDAKLREFFELAYKECEDMFGQQNVIYGVTHFDEVHSYTDPQDKQVHESREGLHVVVIPMTDDMDFVPEKYKSGLNMNNFYRRNLPTLINKRLDSVCNKVFGFDFQDGTGKKGKESVEALKQASSEFKAIADETKQKKEEFEDISERIDKRVDAFNQQITQLNDNVDLLNKTTEMLINTVSSVTGTEYNYDPYDDETDYNSLIITDITQWKRKQTAKEQSLHTQDQHLQTKQQQVNSVQNQMRDILTKSIGQEYPDDFDTVVVDFKSYLDTLKEREEAVEEKEASLDEQQRQYDLDRSALVAERKAVKAKEQALERQNEVKLHDALRQLKADNKITLDTERQRQEEQLNRQNEIALQSQLKQQNDRLKEEYQREISIEKQRLQAENEQILANSLREQVDDVRQFRNWKRGQTLADDTGYVEQGYDLDANGLIRR